MKKYSILLCAIAFVAPALFFAAETPTWQEPQSVYSQTFAANSVKAFSITLKAETLSITQGEEESISVEILSNYAEKNPTVTQDNKGNLKIEQKDKKSNLKKRTCTVVLSIPKKFDITDFSLQLGEGSAKLEKLSAATIAIKLEGGTFTINELTATKTLSVSVSDGKFEAKKMEADEVTLDCKKGDLKADKIASKVFTIDADKGTIDVEFNKAFSKDSSVSVGSGSITLALPGSLAFLCNATVESGTLKSDFGLDSKGPRLKAKVGKGSLKIVKR